MLIAFFSDIHANLPDLQAAIEDAGKRKVSRIFCAGDLIGYGPSPDEVCRCLQDSNITAITGNYDLKVLKIIHEGNSAIADLPKKKQKILTWTAEHLSEQSQKYLLDLSDHLEIELSNRRKVLMVHGTLKDNSDDIYPSITSYGIRSKMGDLKTDILVCGHTHIPFVKKVGGMLIVNCGSVGQPFDGDPSLSYDILDLEDNKAYHAGILRVKYDVEKTIEMMKGSSLPKRLCKDLASGTKRIFLK